MTARDVFAEIVAVDRFGYVPDSTSKDVMVQLLEDTWDTAEEVERRGAADCDGHAIWCLHRGAELALAYLTPVAPLGEWRLVAGVVLQRGLWLGHAWCALALPGRDEEWADPTWHLGPCSPQAMGYPTTRRPRHRWVHLGGGQFDRQEDYGEIPA